MRRLEPKIRAFLTHSGQTLGFAALGLMAMAAAPQAVLTAMTPDIEGVSPIDPPLVAEVEDPGPPLRIIRFEHPVKNRAVNSRFGFRRLASEGRSRHHGGIDIAAPQGTPVLATAEGVVTAVGHDRRGYGRYVEVRHPNGLTSFYAHLSATEAVVGQRVFGGERVGRVGSTGYSTGPHLHFEIRRGGQRMNPAHFIGRELAVRIPGDAARG